MIRKFIVIILLTFCVSSIYSQNKKEELLTIDNKPVYVSEFKRVYQKNLDLVKDESQKSVMGYLDLFIDYKLKVAEAYAQELHKKQSYRSELLIYQEQLSSNYLYEDKVAEDVAREAYERSLDEIEASHLLIRIESSSPQDTLAAYNKIKELRKRAVNGEDFNELVRKYSEEPNADKQSGFLGYFSALVMVYPFETTAYNTKVGEISDIVRTRYGYHIIKVTDRRKKAPEILVSHIMISEKKGPKTFDAEQRINEIYQLIQQGESFESLAKQFSDDRNSAKKGGELKPFTKGELRSKEFETEAYKLSVDNKISNPFKTEFGWHIIKFKEELPIKTFEERKVEIEKRVRSGNRAKIITNTVNNSIKQKYGFKKINSYLPFFSEYVTDSVLKRRWRKEPISKEDDKKLFIIGDHEVFYSDFADFIYERQLRIRPHSEKNELLKSFYDEFETQELKIYFRKDLEKQNEEYAATISEYRDGLLIFDVMNNNVWDKAKKDSVGLENYFNKVKDNYRWKKRVDVDIITAQTESLAKKAQKLLENQTGEQVKELMNNDKVNVILTSNVFEVDNASLPNNYKPSIGISDIIEENDAYIVVKTKNIIPSSQKELSKIRGKVMSDYQNYIEEQWLEKLRDKYKVNINKKALKKIIKEYKS
ncbi:peptidylprolyl isomerase [Patiriisocius hiemis]|uniref:peptidylprolyl isomerase n=1 Tax=Patiriisocius hiemis TaxID=3075604 RepID=A0ABU2Y948_9FLAO|nr:peptidylprolyl isomerase [Constantimarinum sp. W242]MDT0554704.1 peptidylprolyl isomerase [Constantimarinum sp. W242]